MTTSHDPRDTQEPQNPIATKETRHGVIIVDACDADFLSCTSAYAYSKSKLHYAVSYLDDSAGKKKQQLTHRVILGQMIGRELTTKEQVDHINGNGLDNRRANLRLATPSQNHGNRKRGANNTSGFKGVSWCKKMMKWKTTIMIDGVNKHLGYHADPAEAHEAYMTAARQYFGEFANDGVKK